MSSSKTKSVVFVNGAWMSRGCWSDFQSPFQAAGYTVHLLDWPGLDGDPAQLRAQPPKGLGSLSIAAIVDHYAAFIQALPEPPLIIGHSFGGLFTQMLLERGLGVAGVAIDPAPHAGIIPGPVSLSAAFPVLARFGAWARPFTLSKAAFDATFANTAPPALRDEAYNRLVVPTSGMIFLQAASWIGSGVNPKQRMQPLLITVGEKDRTVTPYVARAAYHNQKASPAVTDFEEFPGVSHFLIAEPGWERVARYVIDWADRVS